MTHFQSICYKEPLHICFCLDRNLVDHLLNVIVSILRKNDQYALYFHIIVDETVDLKGIKRLYTKNIFPQLSFTFYTKAWCAKYKGIQHVTKATMLRLYIPDVIQQASTVVYLDIDIVTHCDLVKELQILCQDPNFNNTGIAMKNSIKINYFKTNSVFRETSRTQTGVSHFSGNCGVMFMDLNRLRENNFVANCLDLCQKHPEYHDQEIINLYCRGKHGVLPPNLNIYCNQDSKLLEENKSRFIFHFAGSNKPYRANTNIPHFQYLWDSNKPSLWMKHNESLTFGVLKYTNPDTAKASSNIGDYVQSLAALQYYRKYIAERLNVKFASFDLFLDAVCANNVPNVNFVFLERDNMCKHSDHYGYKNIITLMNGWWLHTQNKKLIFEIPENVTPLFISFHIHEKGLMKPPFIDVLKRFQPIGCRDEATLKLLDEHGVETYFSGCLTVGLDIYRWKDDQDSKTIYVDVKHMPDKSIIDIAHENSIYKNGDCRYMLKKALELLRIYSTSKNVRTSRLHCYMPCVAMGVPVELTSPNDNKAVTNWGPGQRFKGLVDVVTSQNKSEFVNKQLKDIFNFIDRNRS